MMLHYWKVRDRAIKIFECVKMDGEHGIKHADTVVDHINKAFASDKNHYKSKDKLPVLLAGLLHDVDDSKFFDTKDYSNARWCMRNIVNGDIEDRVIHMIDLVSCRKNGNDIKGSDGDVMLYPRLADRLEAIGEIGIHRCMVYAKYKGRPVFDEYTPRPKTREEIFELATPKRFAGYMSGIISPTSVDHFYDKMIQIANFRTQTTNKYLISEADARLEVMIEYLLNEAWRNEV